MSTNFFDVKGSAAPTLEARPKALGKTAGRVKRDATEATAYVSEFSIPAEVATVLDASQPEGATVLREAGFFQRAPAAAADEAGEELPTYRIEEAVELPVTARAPRTRLVRKAKKGVLEGLGDALGIGLPTLLVAGGIAAWLYFRKK